MKSKEKQCSEARKSITIKVPVELKKQIDDERKLTGQTITQIVERADANLFNSDQSPSLSNAEQELQTKQLREIANELRLIVHKLDNITKEMVPLLVIDSRIAAYMPELVAEVQGRVSNEFHVRSNSKKILAIKRI